MLLFDFLQKDHAISLFCANHLSHSPWELSAPSSSWSRHTPSIGHSQSLQDAGNMQLVWYRTRFSIVAMSMFFTNETDLSEIVTTLAPEVATLLSSYAPRSKLSACCRPSRRPNMKKSTTRAPECKFASLIWKKWNGEATPREHPPASKT